MMILGTWFGAWAGYQWEPVDSASWSASSAAPLGGLLHAIITVTFNVNHIVSGVAINILALGVTRYLVDLLAFDEASRAARQAVPAGRIARPVHRAGAVRLAAPPSRHQALVLRLRPRRDRSAAWSPTSPG